MESGWNPYTPTSVTNSPNFTPCIHCGMIHGAICSRIKAIEYHQDGSVKRVEYHEPRPLVSFPNIGPAISVAGP